MSLINFTLRHPDDIKSWGESPDESMHWFGLTDSYHWLELGDATIYEYTEEIFRSWDVNGLHYVDYYLIRLIEDLTQIFPAIAEPVPDVFFRIAKNHESLYAFYGKATKWLEDLLDDPAIDEDTYYDKYCQLTAWIDNRTLTSMHLQAGPALNFFRNGDELAIVWNTGHVNKENIRIWTAGNGEKLIPFDDFVSEVESFGSRFFEAMDKQVQIAIEKDWGTIKLDKIGLAKEHLDRKADFEKSVTILKGTSTLKTDWGLLGALISEMNVG